MPKHVEQLINENIVQQVDVLSTVKCRCNECQYNEMFRIAK